MAAISPGTRCSKRSTRPQDGYASRETCSPSVQVLVRNIKLQKNKAERIQPPSWTDFLIICDVLNPCFLRCSPNSAMFWIRALYEALDPSHRRRSDHACLRSATISIRRVFSTAAPFFRYVSSLQVTARWERVPHAALASARYRPHGLRHDPRHGRIGRRRRAHAGSGRFWLVHGVVHRYRRPLVHVNESPFLRRIVGHEWATPEQWYRNLFQTIWHAQR